VVVDFDYVIVGAGAAGCVLASRLSEHPDNQVLLLECGGRDAHPLLCVPEGFYFALWGNRYAYHYSTQLIGPGGQAEAWLRGKVLSGSTAVNGMMWTRDAAADWDGLAARGNRAFGWKRVLEAYRRWKTTISARRTCAAAEGRWGSRRSKTTTSSSRPYCPPPRKWAGVRRLRVRGVTAPRIVDGCVLPVQVAGNTQAPAMAVAWIAADLILEDS
jgi:choline dehydrogenase-like flavoprotein